MLQSSVRRRGPVKGQGPQSPRITQAWTEVPKGHRAPGQRGAISPSPGLSCGTWVSQIRPLSSSIVLKTGRVKVSHHVVAEE